MNFADLPPHLRGILVAALLLTIAISAGAFALSFLALDSIAGQPGLQWTGLSWVFPFCIDALLVVAELALVAASCVTIPRTGRPASRMLPFCFMLAFGATSVWLNTTRVPGDLRFVASIPPLASICGTIMIAFLVKLLAQSMGRDLTYHAPPPQLLQGTVWRQDASPYPPPPGAAPGMYGPPAPWSAFPSPTASTNGHPGNGAGQLEASDATKRALIDLYLSRLSSEALQVATGSSIEEGVRGEYGVTVSNREALRQLDSFRSTHLPARKRGRA